MIGEICSCWAAAVQKGRFFFRVFSVFCVYVYISRSEKMGKMMKLELYFLLGQLCQLEKVDKLLGLQVLLRVK